MEKNKKIISISIIIVIFLILILLILINTVNNLNTNKLENNTILSNETDLINNEIKTDEELGIYYHEDKDLSNAYLKKLKHVNNIDYFIIYNIANNYINSAGSGNKNVIDSLSKEYISKYNITETNIFNKLNIIKLEKPKQYYKIVTTSILETSLDNSTEIYIVDGYYRIVGNDKNAPFKILIEVDKKNNIYAIYPEEYIIDRGFDKLKENDIINYEKETIEKNNNNIFNYYITKDSEILENLFYQLKEMLLYYPEIAFQKLDQEYSMKRFRSKNEFYSYLEQVKYKLLFMNINEYKVEKNNNYTDYVCTDQYNNVHIFRITNGDISNYKVFLDNYTIPTEYDIKYYNESEEFEKANFSLGKFRAMLNNKDYSAIYNILDNTFKTNNFGNENNLKQYLSDNVYEINNLNIIDRNYGENGYYTYTCELVNFNNPTQKKETVFIVKLEEGTDFTMSFSFN